MAARKRFEWNGDELLRKIEAETRNALRETLDDAASEARRTHPWRKRRGARRYRRGGPEFDPNLERQIKRGMVVVTADGHVRGSFGYTRDKGFYGLFHELGTAHEREFPTIRPAADRVFPTFVERLRRRLT